jgi:uncharacterized protein YbcV (DUF1398 family)
MTNSYFFVLTSKRVVSLRLPAVKFNPFFEEIKSNGLNYEVKYVAGNLKETTLLD